MMVLSSRPFCPCDGRQAGLGDLPARWWYTTRNLTHLMQQRKDRQTAVTDKDQRTIRQPACEQPDDLPGSLGQFLMPSPPFLMVALRGAQDCQERQAPNRTGPRH